MAAATAAMKPMRMPESSGDFWKACCDEMAPERVTQVATMVSTKVTVARATVQRLKMPRLT